MFNLERLLQLENGIYKICKSLIYIVDMECCTYGQDEAVDMADDYVKAYEADHPELKEESDD